MSGVLPSRVVVFLALIASAPAQADIFKCQDAAGHVTYSNVPNKECKRLLLDPVNTVPAAKAPPRSSPAGFPRVDEATQQRRDDGRRRILESELAAEQQSLTEARQALAAQEAVRNGDERNYQRVLERLQPYKDKVSLHERNVEALNKELANLK